MNTAEAFHTLHTEGLLVLANAWDAGTARLIESLGAKAIATTSAGVAWSNGYPDGDQLPVPLLAATVKSIARVVRVPISVDMEGGYSSDPAAVGEAVAAVIEAGGVGINIEDGEGSPDALCAKIEQAKRAGQRRGVDVFVNARTDVYLLDLAPKDRRVDEVLARAALYRAAGADGLFVPYLVDAAEITAIAAGAKLPLNVLARPGLPGLAELQALGVRRLSAGAALTRAAYGRTAVLARAYMQSGASELMGEGAIASAEIQALMGGV